MIALNIRKEFKRIHTEYIFDLGEHPVRAENKQRFHGAYPTTRSEYTDHHAFKMKIDGRCRWRADLRWELDLAMTDVDEEGDLGSSFLLLLFEL